MLKDPVKIITVKMPCCEHRGASKHTVRTSPAPQDRKCPHCKHWWRVDVRKLSQRGDRHVHVVEWTHVGLLS